MHPASICLRERARRTGLYLQAMRVKGPLFAVSALAFTVAACSLPERGNDFDPALRPRAVLALSHGPFDLDTGTCEPADSLSVELSRARCLHLSGVGSTDPQGSEDIASWQYSLVSATNEEIAYVEGGVIAVATTTWGPAVLRSQAPRNYRVRLEVVDRSGRSHAMSTDVVLSNDRPVAVAPGPRQITNWGASWTTNGSYATRPLLDVHFSGAASVDPDGDALRYCWRDIGSDPGVDYGCFPSPDFSVAAPQIPPNTRGGIFLELSVHDAGANGDVTPGNRSEPVLASAILDTLPAWGYQRDTGSALVMDLDRTGFDLPADFGHPLGILYRPQRNWGASELVYLNQGSTMMLHKAAMDDPDTLLDFIGLGMEIGALDVVPGAGKMWVVGAQAGDGVVCPAIARCVSAAVVSTGDFTVFSGPTLSDVEVQNAAGEGAGMVLRVDPNTGDAWVGLPLGATPVVGFRHQVGAGGAAPTVVGRIPIAPGRLLSGLELRIPSGGPAEVLVAESPDVFDSQGDTSPPDLHVWTTSATPIGTIELHPANEDPQPAIAMGLDFVIRGSGWMNFFGAGLALVDLCDDDRNRKGPAPLDPAAMPHLCVRSISPDVPAGFDYVVSRKTGVYLGLGTERFDLARATLDGASSRFESTIRFQGLLGPDPEDRIWSFVNSGVVYRGKGSGEEGVILRTSVPLSLTRRPVVDYASGDLLLGSALPPGVVRIYSDGRPADYIGSVLPDGAPGAVPVSLTPPNVVATDPQTGAIWVVTGFSPLQTVGGDTVFLIDPYAPRPSRDPSVGIAVPGAPVPLLPASVLDAVGEHIVDAASIAQDKSLLLQLWSKAGDGISGSPCQAAVPGDAPDDWHVYLRRLGRDGTLTPAPPSSGTCIAGNFPANNGDDRIAMDRDLSNGEVCVAFREGTDIRVRRFDVSLSPIAAFEASIPAGGDSAARAVAATPAQCWAGIDEGGGQAIMVDETGLLRVSPTGIPAISAIVPKVGLAEVAGQTGASRAWVGGDAGDLVRLDVAPGSLVVTTAKGFTTSFETILAAP